MKLELIKQMEIRALLALYHEEIEKSDIKPLTKKIYQSHSSYFVRWLEGNFKPGANGQNISRMTKDDD